MFHTSPGLTRAAGCINWAQQARVNISIGICGLTWPRNSPRFPGGWSGVAVLACKYVDALPDPG